MFARHRAFLTALALGLIAGGLAIWLHSGLPRALLIGADVLFLAYLLQLARHAAEATPQRLRAHAALPDEGVAVILALALLAVLVGVSAVVLALQGAALWERIAGLVSVPLGWATLHGLAARHYAALFYDAAPEGDRRGLSFPGTHEPDLRDFLYYSFTIGMAAQTADVVIDSQPMRRATVAHAVLSFFYNAVILALAVSAAL